MKPIIIVPPKFISEEDMKLLRENGICAIEAQDPEKVRFVDPIPCRTQLENAAIKLSRKVMNPKTWTDQSYTKTFTHMFCEILLDGTPLGPNATPEEQAAEIVRIAKIDELHELGKQQAREEMARKKLEKQKPSA